MGFVHYNNTVEDQVNHVYRAKHHLPGYMACPMVLSPEDTISKIDQLQVRNLNLGVVGIVCGDCPQGPSKPEASMHATCIRHHISYSHLPL